MIQEPLAQRIRDSLNWLTRTPTRNSAGYQQAATNVRDSVRQLSRQRVSNLLRQLRATHGLSYADVQLATGLPQQLIFDIEFKDHRLALDELRLLADCYRVSIGDILGIEID